MTVNLPQYTQMPNELLAQIPHMREAELKVVLVVARRTLGFGKPVGPISLTELVEATGMSRKAVVSGVERAINNDHIVKLQGKSGHSNHYGLKFNVDPQRFEKIYGYPPYMGGQSSYRNTLPESEVVTEVNQSGVRKPLEVVTEVHQPLNRNLKKAFKENFKETWEVLKNNLKPNMARATFDTYVSSTCLTAMDAHRIVVGCQSAQQKAWLEQRFSMTARRELVGLLNAPLAEIELEFQVIGEADVVPTAG